MASAPPSSRSATNTHESLVSSFRALSAWMRANGAGRLADNLAPKAKTIQLVLLEKKLQFKVPPGLRALWLMHDGQLRPKNRFFGPLQFLPVSWVLNERTATKKLLLRLRAAPSRFKEAGVTAGEAASDQWLPFASHKEACLVVEAKGERVFEGSSGELPLVHVADSVPAWLADYAARVEGGEFELVADDEGSFLSAQANI